MYKRDAANYQGLPKRMHRLSDSGWLELLVESVASRSVAGITLPAFPSVEVQVQFTGSANAQTLLEAFGFYGLIKESSTNSARRLARTAGCSISVWDGAASCASS